MQIIERHPRSSLKKEKPYLRDMSKFYKTQNTKVTITIEGKPNKLYSQGMRSFEQYDEACKYFAERRLANEVQAQLQLHDVSVGEYLVNKYPYGSISGQLIKMSYTELAGK